MFLICETGLDKITFKNVSPIASEVAVNKPLLLSTASTRCALLPFKYCCAKILVCSSPPRSSSNLILFNSSKVRLVNCVSRGLYLN